MKNKGLHKFIDELVNEFNSIPTDRRIQLEELAETINSIMATNGKVDLILICTHNSRRSQLGEAWISTACQFYNLDNIIAYSGGTEATAFNIRMIVAMRQVSFHLQTEQPADNPRYMLTALRHTEDPHYMYSKTFDDPYNPQDGFIALMVCSDADTNCPVVRGASHRVSLPYLDPKEFDDTPMEHDAYMDKVREIGREFLYMMSKVTPS